MKAVRSISTPSSGDTMKRNWRFSEGEGPDKDSRTSTIVRRPVEAARMSRPARHRRARCTTGATTRPSCRTRSSGRSAPSRCSAERRLGAEARPVRRTCRARGLGRAEMTFRCARSDSGARSGDAEHALAAPRRPVHLSAGGNALVRVVLRRACQSSHVRVIRKSSANPVLRTIANVPTHRCNAIKTNEYSPISTAGNVLFILPYNRLNQIHNKSLGPLGKSLRQR